MSSSTGWLSGTDNLQVVPCSWGSSVMSHSARLGSWLRMPAQGFPCPWAHQHSSAGGCFRGTTQTLAPNGAEVRGTSAKASRPPPAPAACPTKAVNLCISLHLPGSQREPWTRLSFRNSPKAHLSCQPPSQALLRDTCPPLGLGASRCLDSGIRYRDCVQP